LTEINQHQIRIIPSKELDRERWDACIALDQKGLIYSYCWFLDGIIGEWDGLVVNDYEAVMALPRKKKWGIEFVGMPAFVQRLGLSGRYDDEIIHMAGQAVRERFKLIEYAAAEPMLFGDVTKRRKTNFVMPLVETYEVISDRYTSACKKNVGKARKRGCELAEDVEVKDVLKFYGQVYGGLAAYTDKHFEVLERLLEAAATRRPYHVAGVRNRETNELVYAGLLLDDGRRVYYVLGAPNRDGREMRATYFFIDEMIRKFCGSRKIFDFEGSDIPDVATFYQSFSPEAEYYYLFYINQYSNPLKKLIDLKMAP
jgi:hypothetical protein